MKQGNIYTDIYFRGVKPIMLKIFYYSKRLFGNIKFTFKE